jgi:hypothetical protein
MPLVRETPVATMTSLRLLAAGLARFGDAPAPDRARALIYRAELAVRTNDQDLARESLDAAIALELTESERLEVADEIAHAAEVVATLN